MRARDTTPDRAVAPRDRRVPQGHHAAVSPAVARLLALHGTAGNRAVAARLGVHRQFDEAFVEKKAKEQKALEKWNAAASGRSQGLIHVIDYAKARPPKKVEEVPPAFEAARKAHTEAEAEFGPASDQAAAASKKLEDHKLWLTFMAGHPLSGAQLAKAFGKDPLNDTTIAWLNKFTKPLELFSAAKDLQGQIAEREKTLAMTMKAAADKRAARASAPVVSLAGEIADLKSQLVLKNRWVVGRDDSKKGRIEQVEQAVEKKTPGQRPNYAGNEILGVTGALDELVDGGKTTERPARGFGDKITAPNQWVKKAEGTQGKSAGWKQEDVVFEGSAYDEESSPAGLRVVKWGPKGKTKYSTVMGGSG